MGIIQLFQKKSAKQIKPIEKVVVVFNIVNHESLLASVLYTLIRQDLDKIDVVLADVRDDIPQDADQYVWIGVDNVAYADILTRLYGDGKTFEEHRSFVTKVTKESIVIRGDNKQRLLEETLNALESAQPVSHAQISRRFIVASEVFMEHKVELETLELYSRTLDTAYRYYQGEAVTLDDFHRLASGTDSMKEFWLENQKKINKTATLKMRPVSINGRLLFMLNTTGPEVYFLLRRLSLSHKEWVHVSSGTHGVVVFSSVPINMDKEKHLVHVLKIQPNEMPLGAFGKKALTSVAS
jgi:hypothetical protein